MNSCFWPQGSSWPDTPDFVAIAGIWQKDVSTRLLSFVWIAYDDLRHENPASLNPRDERNVTQHLESRIRWVMSGYEPYNVQHGPYENETRYSSRAQPPQYDIAFKLIAEECIMWPLEAKVLKNGGALAAYISDVKKQFLKCRYAPFSSEGAMLGYLLSGDTSQAFRNIAARLRCRLESHPAFTIRAHRVSSHVRKVPTGKSYPRKFICHHLLLRFSMPDEQGRLNI